MVTDENPPLIAGAVEAPILYAPGVARPTFDATFGAAFRVDLQILSECRQPPPPFGRFAQAFHYVVKKPSHDSDGKYAKNHDSKHKLSP